MAPRAYTVFWALVGVAVVATGFVSLAVRAAPGPLTGVVLLVSSVVAAGAVTLAGRIYVLTSAAHARRGRRGNAT